MITRTKKTLPSGRRKAGDGHDPMRGGVLSQLASAFRLRQRVTGDSAEVAEGTANQGLNDQRDIGRGRHVSLLRAAVDGLFTKEYLAVRGLRDRDATNHNDLVTQALEAVLTRWDPLAAFNNVLPGRLDPIREVFGIVTGYSVELAMRLAAYEALYGYLHPVLKEIPTWPKGRKLAGWWASIERRARKPIQVSLLYEQGVLDSHTIRAIRDGKSLPNEGTIDVLASRLASHHIRDRTEARNQDVAEIAFELRVAIAVAEHQELIERVLAARPEDGEVTDLWILRSLVAPLPDDANAELLRAGTGARLWPQLEAAYRGAHTYRLVQMAMAMKRDADAKMAALEQNPEQSLRKVAEECAQHATSARALDRRPGADGPERRYAEFFEQTHHMTLAAASKGKHVFPALRREWLTEMKADHLCMEAVELGLGGMHEEAEQRLREAVEICTWSAFAHRSLAHHLQGAGKVEESIFHYRRSIELNPENQEGRELLVLLLHELEQHDEVLALTEGGWPWPTLRAARAHALFKLGDAIAAERIARENLDAHPRHPMALRVLAGCLRTKGEEKDARELERKADFFEHGVAPPST
jgi:tetratricopeptide (TPR) repeat protein